MKIALCISGHLRTFDFVFPRLKDNLLSLHKSIDIFIHTWDRIDYVDGRCTDYVAVKNIYNPKMLCMDKPYNYEIPEIIQNKNVEMLRNTRNVMSMFYSVKKCNQLKYEYEEKNGLKYDCVIRWRGDIDLFSKMYIDKCNMNKMYIPRFGDFGNNGINDQVAWSNSKNMDVYCSLYDNIEEYLKNDNNLVLMPEILLRHHLNNNGIYVERPKIDYNLQKTLGCILNNEKRERDFGFIE